MFNIVIRNDYLVRLLNMFGLCIFKNEIQYDEKIRVCCME